ncbi:hypothetical protein I302_100768 [Kwoniella bestiolae CBS 10118]|uniref:PH domain-containing protein n=1 Tax=Kwoniella bestiolae CBS 10118 TaxID=1296100 RepID=A0A1B9G610_9TREE|nr:hypothetical protein I302_04141 [Kwoniella bestiolae CBS 10118]OCF26456.1 hypothetical protein I302_04141 [Kwoniella bestiolae CBS 10118]
MSDPKYSPHQIGALPFEQDPRYYPNPPPQQHQQSYHSRFRYHAQPPTQASIQLYDSYFPLQQEGVSRSATNFAQAIPKSQQSISNTNNVDDIVYRYSSEFDRIVQAPGTPTVGIYSQDGLWDEEEDNLNSKQQGPSRKITIIGGGTKNRTGTVYSTSAGNDKNWTWRRPSMSQLHNSPSMSVEEQIPVPLPVPPKGLEKKKSKGLLRGKGSRGELSVNVTPDADESFEAPPPLPIPATPASFITESSPASFSSPTFSPLNYSSSTFETPATFPTPPIVSTTNSKTTKTPKSGSSWKRGMQRIFKSKSSAALREAASNKEASLSPPPMPNLPNLPGPSNHSLGKAFSASTPPLGDSRRYNNLPAPGYLSTPPSTTSESFVPPLFPNSLNDPFASSLDLTCNNPISSPLASPKPRPTLRHNSPSLRDLKNLLPGHSKPAIMKAKSFATLHQRENSRNISKEKEKEQDRAGHSSKLSKRMSSLVGLNIFAHAAPEQPGNLEPLEHPPTQASLAPPIESPPLLPPQPPYFQGASRSPSLPSIISDDSSSTPEESPRISMPPSAPLPPVPASASSTNLAAPIQRSGSGAVLLPRSRSTSMSFKSPPTSSSFFDLYEQLGIWPSAEKEKKEIHDEPEEMDTSAETDKDKAKALEEDKENITPPPIAEVQLEDDLEHAIDLTDDAPTTHLQVDMPRSETISSTASWNVALNSFPEAPGNDSLDFGLPYVADEEVVEPIIPSTQHSDRSDVLSIVAVAASSRNSSHQTTVNNSMSTDRRGSGSTVTHATSVGMEYLNSSFSSKGRGRASGSGNSSRDSSPERERDNLTDREGSEASSSEDDDVPLSKLHPEAAAAQLQRRETRRKTREARKAKQVKVVERRKSEKTQGRNPGGEHGWDGEGGIPADVLTKKLEAVLIRRAEREAAGPGMIPQGLKTHRSMREPSLPPTLDYGIRRAQSQGHAAHPSPTTGSWKHDHPPLPPIQTQTTIPHRAPQSHGVFNPESAISPTNTSFGRIPSAKRVDPAFAQAMQGYSHEPTSHPMGGYGDRSRQSSVATSSSSRIPGAPAGTRAPSRQDDLSAQVTRSNTNATQYSVASSRSRAHSNGVSPLTQRDESAALHARSVTEPLPHAHAHTSSSHHPASASAGAVAATPAQRVHASVPAFVSALNGKKIMLDLTSTTTAREVLVSTYHKGDLVDATVGKSWVLCEIFAEMGCERQIREYEPLLPIVKGWDQTAKFNCFVFKQSNRGMPTWARAVPTFPPMLGQWVQYETKKGKWTKRWLETRGGQVFLAKNEKNKDEIHINSLFFDIYAVTRGYDAPKPSTFIMKRVEPSSNFEDPSDYAHIFSCDEGLAFKLMAAIYDAKSYAISQTHPSMISSQLPTPTATAKRPSLASHNSGSGPSVHQQPLVSLVPDDKERKSAFTGKGLLKI